MSPRERAINDQVVDLTEIVRQQQEYITDLEMELVEFQDKWNFVKEELDQMKTQKILEEEFERPRSKDNKTHYKPTNNWKN